MPSATLRCTDSADAPFSVEVASGFPAALDEAARRAPTSHAFLRSAWFGNDAAPARTIVGRRADGEIFAAVPLAPLGTALVGATRIPGAYWPFRAAPIAEDATEEELRALLDHDSARRALGPAWRIGPVYADDAGIGRLARAAETSGWTRLERMLGTTFVMDFAEMRRLGTWPRASRSRRIRAHERRLAAHAPVSFRFCRGASWDASALDAMATIEANSWVGLRTDGSGAKFLRPEQRQHWQAVLSDSHLAAMLSAAILSVGDTPVAFSFDLNVGALQYGLASSYDDRFADFSPGQIVTWHHLEESEARGISLVDWGSGDNGYKQHIGAGPGSAIVDLLFVRSRPLAAVLRPKWSGGQSAGDDRGAAKRLSRREQLLLAVIATAAAAASFSE